MNSLMQNMGSSSHVHSLDTRQLWGTRGDEQGRESRSCPCLIVCEGGKHVQVFHGSEAVSGPL